MSPNEETEVIVEKPKRAPRKRLPRAVSDGSEESAPVKRAPAKRTPKKVIEDVPVVEVSSQRKAPTPIAGTRVNKKKSRKQSIVVTVMILLGVGTSAVVGFTDTGSIDVNQMIETRNERIRKGELQDTIVPVQNTNQQPDGGLIQLSPEEIAKQVEQDAAKTAAAAPAVATSTASTTQEGNVPLPDNELESAPAAETPAL